MALLRVAGSADLAAATGFLARASERGTPVLLDGVISGTCAMLAERLAPGSSALWRAGHRSTEPAHRLALEALGLCPILDLEPRRGEGSGALTALPVLRTAALPARRDGHPGRGHRVSSLGDGLRLATGTLTVLPVPPPRTVCSPVAGLAMALAPLVVLPLGAAAALVAWAGDAVAAPPLLTAALAVAVLALGSGFLHLDGLADTADGLAVKGDRGRRLEVMRRGDVGRVGVVTLVLVLLVQVSTLAGLLAAKGAALSRRDPLPRRGRESGNAGGDLRTGSPTRPRRRSGERGRRVGAAGPGRGGRGHGGGGGRSRRPVAWSCRRGGRDGGGLGDASAGAAPDRRRHRDVLGACVELAFAGYLVSQVVAIG